MCTDSTEKYDTRDLERFQKDDTLVESYLTWRQYVVDDALKMIDESLQWRKELALNGKMSFWLFVTRCAGFHSKVVLGILINPWTLRLCTKTYLIRGAFNAIEVLTFNIQHYLKVELLPHLDVCKLLTQISRCFCAAMGWIHTECHCVSTRLHAFAAHENNPHVSVLRNFSE